MGTHRAGRAPGQAATVHLACRPPVPTPLQAKRAGKNRPIRRREPKSGENYRSHPRGVTPGPGPGVPGRTHSSPSVLLGSVTRIPVPEIEPGQACSPCKGRSAGRVQPAGGGPEALGSTGAGGAVPPGHRAPFSPQARRSSEEDQRGPCRWSAGGHEAGLHRILPEAELPTTPTWPCPGCPPHRLWTRPLGTPWKSRGLNLPGKRPDPKG